MSEAKRSEPRPRSRGAGAGEELRSARRRWRRLTDGGRRERERGRRRSKTMSRKEIARELRRQRAFGHRRSGARRDVREIEASRPRSRADCANGPRPCMFISCKHHLYLDVNPATGLDQAELPGPEVWELDETCALDVADKGGITLEEVGSIMNLTRERIRQVETRGLAKLRDDRGGRAALAAPARQATSTTRAHRPARPARAVRGRRGAAFRRRRRGAVAQPLKRRAPRATTAPLSREVPHGPPRARLRLRQDRPRPLREAARRAGGRDPLHRRHAAGARRRWRAGRLGRRLHAGARDPRRAREDAPPARARRHPATGAGSPPTRRT